MKLQVKNKEVFVTRRKDIPREDIWFDLVFEGRKYSLMNCGELMKTAHYPSGAYIGWEILSDTGEIIRGDSFSDVLHNFIKLT